MTEPKRTTWGSLRQVAEDATKPLPDDWYDVIIEKTEATTASTGSPMIKIILVVTSGPQANNRKIWTQAVFKDDSPFAMNMFFKTVGAFGLDENFFNTLPDNIADGIPLIARALEGRTARAHIAPRPYQGVERDNVMEYMPDGKEQPVVPTGGVGSVAGAPTPGGVVSAPSAPTPGGSVVMGNPAPTSVTPPNLTF